MDSFAGLSWKGDPPAQNDSKKSKMKSMSLADKQKIMSQQARNVASMTTHNSSVWSGLDTLSDNGSSRNASSVNVSSNGLGQSSSLLDVFDDTPVKTTSTVSSSTMTANELEDDPFAVFNRAVPKVDPVASFTASVNSSADHSPAMSSGSASTPASRSASTEPRERTPPASKADPGDRAVAELIDMGFSDVQARDALRRTHNGLDVREAIEYIMNEAHTKTSGQSANALPRKSQIAGLRKQMLDPNADYSRMAQDLGTQIFSKASSFWSQGKKQLSKTIEQYQNQGSKDGLPAWARGQQIDVTYEDESFGRATYTESESNDGSVTAEALRLERDVRRPKKSSSAATGSRDTSRGLYTESDDKEQRRAELLAKIPRATSRNSRGSSPSSKTTIPSPSLAQKFKNSISLTDSEDEIYRPASRRSQAPEKTQSSKGPISLLTPKTQRPHIHISPTQLQMAMQSKEAGLQAYKRGDFSAATELYTQALQMIPSPHLTRAVLLSNRATCYFKTGDFPAAITDADEGLNIIGPSYGAGEEIEPGKSLKDIWAKLQTRKAESLEGREKFKEAMISWELLLNNGFSNITAMTGRRRCQAALTKPPAITRKSATTSASPVSQSAGPKSAAGIAAVQRVKNSNAQAAKAEAEKFALHDSVEVRLAEWRNGKEDNLRALLSSLDGILWRELGWNSVSLAELVLPKKVKLVYMKAAAKTHPDKVPSSASTEQKMISQAVFITLNKAWDSFRAENNL